MTRAVIATAYGGPEVLELINDDPGLPGPGRVLLRVRAAGVNPADWKRYKGTFGTDPADLPLRLGYEAAGVVRAVGEGVTSVAVGDEVIAYPIRGAYADRVIVPESSLLPKPAAMSWEKAAGLMVAGVTAAHALQVIKIGAGDTLLLHGASGGVGGMAVQLARAKGARVIGTASPHNHEYLVDLGATPLDYGPDLADRVTHASQGPIDAAIDTAGTLEALQASVALVPDRRRVATIAGFEHGARLGVQLLGTAAGADPGTEIRRAARSRLVQLWEAGRLDVRVGATYQLADVRKAHEAGIARRVTGKIILVP